MTQIRFRVNFIQSQALYTLLRFLYQGFMYFVNNVALAPPTIAVAIGLIYQQVGPAAFVGLAVTVVLIPLSGAIFGVVNVLRTVKVKIIQLVDNMSNLCGVMK
jgi:hypothetical protein